MLILGLKCEVAGGQVRAFADNRGLGVTSSPRVPPGWPSGGWIGCTAFLPALTSRKLSSKCPTVVSSNLTQKMGATGLTNWDLNGRSSTALPLDQEIKYESEQTQFRRGAVWLGVQHRFLINQGATPVGVAVGQHRPLALHSQAGCCNAWASRWSLLAVDTAPVDTEFALALLWVFVGVLPSGTPLLNHDYDGNRRREEQGGDIFLVPSQRWGGKQVSLLAVVFVTRKKNVVLKVKVKVSPNVRHQSRIIALGPHTVAGASSVAPLQLVNTWQERSRYLQQKTASTWGKKQFPLGCGFHLSL